MTAALNMCRHCDGLILDEADGVLVAVESSISGPTMQIWAHREHARQVKPNPAPAQMLARIRALRGGQQ